MIFPESADAVWSDQGFEQRDEPAVQICNPDSVEARISSCPKAKKNLGSENLEHGSGDLDSPARGAVDNVFVTPARYAKNIYGSVSHSSLASNKQYFPKWFNSPKVGKSNNNNKNCWSNLLPGDELPDIEDRLPVLLDSQFVI